MSLANRGNDFLKFCGVHEAILVYIDEKLYKKFDTFGNVEIRVFTMLGVKRVVFCTFLNLSWSC